MKFPLLSIIACLTVELVATHAALPAEIYWKSVLPSTPMPEPLRDLLHPTGAGTAFGRFPFRRLPRIINCFIKYTQGNQFRCLFPCPACKGQLRYSSNETLFFLEKDLKAGHKMNFLFKHTSINRASFLPREVVKSIPFNSSKMDEILSKFGVKRGSVGAKLMKNTINICEEPGIKGEEKYCVTSLESMVDFVTLKLGKSVKALSMGLMNQTKEEEYTIMHGVKKVEATQVVCHKLHYVYAVFLCHKIENTVVYTVPLEAANGSRVKAICVCHKDTSAWDPKHFAFEFLKVKPGSVPVCHFLYHDTITWVPRQH